MSDQRPEWMPSDDEINASVYADDKEHESGHPNVEAVIHRTGLRAQIAVLEEAAKLCESYNPCHEVFADHFKEKIAALRKELGE